MAAANARQWVDFRRWLALPLLAGVGCTNRVPLAPPPPEVRVAQLRLASASTERADLAMRSRSQG